MNNPYFSGFFAGLKPDTRMTVSEWADEHRILPMKSAKEAGRWRTARTPYLKEIMDCLSPSSSVEQYLNTTIQSPWMDRCRQRQDAGRNRKRLALSASNASIGWESMINRSFWAMVSG